MLVFVLIRFCCYLHGGRDVCLSGGDSVHLDIVENFVVVDVPGCVRYFSDQRQTGPTYSCSNVIFYLCHSLFRDGV